MAHTLTPTGTEPEPGASAHNGTVTLEGATKTYPGTDGPALFPLDLAIEQGEFFSLLGPSGSGKTTLLRLIGGFEFVTAGTVRIGGIDVTREPPFRRPLHTVFQNYALFPHMSVAQNVGYSLRMQGVPKAGIAARVDDIIGKVGLADFAGRRPAQMSGGQRQRVALARALVGRPEVVLLDEPLGALDLRLRQEMQFVLKQLQREFGITFIYVTHDQGEALGMSDRIAILSHGRMHQVGSPEEIYYRPATPFVAQFVGKSNLLKLPGGDGLVTVRPETIRVGGDAGVCEQRFAATVTGVLFQGAFAELELDSQFGELLAHISTGSHFEPGERVEIGWNVDDVLAVSDPGSGFCDGRGSGSAS